MNTTQAGNTDLLKPDDLVMYDDDGLMKIREVIGYKLEELQSMEKMINDEIIRRLKEQNLDGKPIYDYLVSCARRISFKTSLEVAKSLGAIKEKIDIERVSALLLKKLRDENAVTEEVDDKKLRELYKAGVPVPDVTVTEYLYVKAKESPDESE